jgi:predicted NBD/HSP70 family sugar kinase
VRGDLTRSAVLALLGTSGPLSRADLARELEVSPATVTQITKELMARGMVLEVEQAPSRGGRPGQLLGLVGSAGHALGAKVAADHVAIADVRLDGQVLARWEHPLDASGPAAPDALAAHLKRAIEDSAAVGTPLLGVGVGVPGSVDEQATGTVDAPTLGWQRLALGQRLRSALAVPVLVENDVNTLAVAERLYGRGRTHRDFLVVTIGRGVGAGLVVDGTVYRGARGGAGEFGHLPVQRDGEVCPCGNKGCLESLVGADALVREARRADVLGSHGTVDELSVKADDGNLDARAVLAYAADVLGRAVAGLVNVMDPEVVVVLGEGTKAWSHWSQPFESAFRAHLLASRRAVPVEVDVWDDIAWAQGAAALVLATPFDAAGATGVQGELVRARLRGDAEVRPMTIARGTR